MTTPLQLLNWAIFSLAIFLPYFWWYQGEGWILAMEDPGADTGSHFDFPLPFAVSAKPHGAPSAESYGSLTTLWQTGHRVTKRSILRAHKRATNFGYTWFRGALLTPRDFETMYNIPPVPTFTGTTKMTIPSTTLRPHTPKRRLQVIVWNSGGLSSGRFWELTHWLSQQTASVVIIPETRWKFTREWSTKDWNFIHSHGDDAASGLLILLHHTLAKSDDILWEPIVPGRLVHLRLHGRRQTLDILAGYQHTWQHGEQQLHRRRTWWTRLRSTLTTIPRRNQLLLAGDFNCALGTSHNLVGTPIFDQASSPNTGFLHPDMWQFQEIVNDFHLIALNTWDPHMPPTFRQGQVRSRIDFVLTRADMTDMHSRQAHILEHAPILDPDHGGHLPLLCQVPSQWHKPASTKTSGITVAQRVACCTERRNNTEKWIMFQHTLKESFSSSLAHPIDLSALHEQFTSIIHRHFPSTSSQSSSPPPSPHVLSKWQHHSQIRIWSRRILRKRMLFHLWHHCIRYYKMKRLHRKHNKQLKHQRLTDAMTQANQLNENHDSAGLFALIKKISPKTTPTRMQLRAQDGTMMTPEEELTLLSAYVREVWQARPFDQHPTHCTRNPLSFEQVHSAIANIPPNKSVALPFASGVAWRCVADHLAHHVFESLNLWWGNRPAEVPEIWKTGYLHFIPKPGRSASHPRNLRPLALMEPVGKAIASAISMAATDQAHEVLTQYPQFAYLPNRGTQECIRRIKHHCESVHSLCADQSSTVATRSLGHRALPFYGGIQLFVDLEKAFDRVSRDVLFEGLPGLGVSDDLVAILRAWHTNTHYVVNHKGMESIISTTNGLRQGCTMSPGLWSMYVILILQDLQQSYDYQQIVSWTTIFADDFHVGRVLKSEEDLTHALGFMGALLDCLHRLHLPVNLAKSNILLWTKGTRGQKALHRFLRHTNTGVLLLVPGAHCTYDIPIKSEVSYLGIKVAYRNMEKLTLTHRLTLSRAAFARLRSWLCGRHVQTSLRLHLWKTFILPITLYGLGSVGLTDTCLRTFQKHIYVQLRKVLRNHSYITGETHRTVLHRHACDEPLELLRHSLTRFSERILARKHNTQPSDIIHAVDWSHLPLLIDRINSLILHRPHIPIDLDPDIEPETRPLHYCTTCHFTTTSLANYRRHCTVHHAASLKRTHGVDLRTHNLRGLPECKHCHKMFSTWTLFRIHVESMGCQPGPTPLRLPQADLGIDPEVTRGLLTNSHLRTSDVAFLNGSDEGRRFLKYVQAQDWTGLREDQPTCQYVRARCTLCGVYTSRMQDLTRHLRQAHRALYDRACDFSTQLQRQQVDQGRCAFCDASYISQHTCPILMQGALFYINGQPQHADGTLQRPLKCHHCEMEFDTASQLQRHILGNHRIQRFVWRADRDLVDMNSPACSHCGSTFTDTSGVRAHIQNGRCKYYDPGRTPNILPVSPALHLGAVPGLRRDPATLDTPMSDL